MDPGPLIVIKLVASWKESHSVFFPLFELVLNGETILFTNFEPFVPIEDLRHQSVN